MAAPAGVSWEELSQSVKETLAWGRAVEVEAAEVGTRGLLIGMLRSSDDSVRACS